MGSGEHQHCAGCFDRNCSSEDDDCRVIDCAQHCGARFHACKEEEHLSLCSRVVVPCLNSQHGCPFSFDRRKLNSHLGHCPANVVSCSHVWFRRNRKEREDGEMPSDPPLPTNYIDFALAYRDQDQIGGVKGLDDCTVSARPHQRVCCGVDIAPRSESVHTLAEPCYAQGAPPVPALGCTANESQEMRECASTSSHRDIQPSSSTTTSPPQTTEASENCTDGEETPPRTRAKSLIEKSSIPIVDTLCDKTPQSFSRRATTSAGDHNNGKTLAPQLSADDADTFSSSLPASLAKKQSNPADIASLASRTGKGHHGHGKKGSGLVKLFGFRHGSTSAGGSTNSVIKETGMSDTDSAAGGSSITSGDLDAFHASMGTKMRSHLQNSKRKIAKVFSGKILHRTTISPLESSTGARALKHKLNPHSPLDSSQDNLSNLEVVTHGDSFVVTGGDSSSNFKPTSPRPSAECSVRSDVSLASSAHSIRYRHNFEEERCNPSQLFQSQQKLIEGQESAERKLLFELPLFYYPRHLYPDDGLIQCQCSQHFRRDEIGEHQLFVHAGIDSLLSAQHLSRRCPFAMYGCKHTSSRLRMPLPDWKLILVKGALATLPSMKVHPSTGKENGGERHLTTLPIKLLNVVCEYLDPLSLSCVSQTCRHLRNVVAAILPQRGMVMPVWERSGGDDEDEDEEVSWRIARYRWTLSTYAQGVPLDSWVQEDVSNFDQHMRHCKFSKGDRQLYGEQWRPLNGLTDVKAIEFVSDSEFEEEESEEESEGEKESAAAPSVMSTCTMQDSRTKAVPKKRSIFRKGPHRRKDGDAFDMSLAVDELLGDEDVDIAEDNIDEEPELVE